MLDSLENRFIREAFNESLRQSEIVRSNLSNAVQRFQSALLREVGLQPRDIRWLKNGIKVKSPQEAVVYDFNANEGFLSFAVILDEHATQLALFTLILEANSESVIATHGQQRSGDTDNYSLILSEIQNNMLRAFREVTLDGSRAFTIDIETKEVTYL